MFDRRPGVRGPGTLKAGAGRPQALAAAVEGAGGCGLTDLDLCDNGLGPEARPARACKARARVPFDHLVKRPSEDRLDKWSKRLTANARVQGPRKRAGRGWSAKCEPPAWYEMRGIYPVSICRYSVKCARCLSGMKCGPSICNARGLVDAEVPARFASTPGRMQRVANATVCHACSVRLPHRRRRSRRPSEDRLDKWSNG
jgi:hypothetical protein